MPLQVREYFTDANVNANIDGNDGARAQCAETGIALRAYFNPSIGTTLTLKGGIMGNDGISVVVDGDQINRTSTVLIDGLKAQLL